MPKDCNCVKVFPAHNKLIAVSFTTLKRQPKDFVKKKERKKLKNACEKFPFKATIAKKRIFFYQKKKS